ncbi:MAG: DUF423 domain-containing protein [Flavobacteriales bacterium CG_4_9_14_3_um_filter_40_17]|nr:MAG: DUF423 domain-containing protein [Flavobacteriales bacterium CG_4_9_14_3_um_filter_40_17]
MKKYILITAALLGMTAILLGAFAAHELKSLISEPSIATFETGVRFQMYHALLLLFLGQTSVLPEKTQKTIFQLAVIGLICFSGSIYLLAINELTAFDFKKIALLTPLGGTLLIVAWAIMLVGFFRVKRI